MDENTIMQGIMVAWIGAGVLLSACLLILSRYLNDLRRVLQYGGLLTAVVGAVTVLGALFVPFGVYTTVTERVGGESEVGTRFESMWAIGIEPFQVLWLAVVLGAAVTVAISALINQSTFTQVIRWIAMLVLIILTWLSSFTIGWMFVPVTLLALVTAIHGARTEAGHPGDEAGEPEHKRAPSPETG